jgi:hypothetical protein
MDYFNINFEEDEPPIFRVILHSPRVSLCGVSLYSSGASLNGSRVSLYSSQVGLKWL